MNVHADSLVCTEIADRGPTYDRPMDEAKTLQAFLDAQREAVLAIVDGLTPEQLTTPVVPSGWTPLGLIEHLGHAERHWFQEVLTGSAPPLSAESLAETGDVAKVFTFYRKQIAIANDAIAGTPLATVPVGDHGEPIAAESVADLRGIVLHMIEETARHAGHLDIARELIDGRTGLGPR